MLFLLCLSQCHENIPAGGWETRETELDQHGEAILGQPAAPNPQTLHWAQPKSAELLRQPPKLTVTVSSTKVMWLVAT